MMSIKKHTIAALLGYLLVAIAFVAWGKLGEVVWFERATMVSDEPGAIQMHVTGYKVRDCRFIPGSAVGYVRTEAGFWVESDAFMFVNDLTPGNSKPRAYSRTSFGVWRWEYTGTATHVMATVGHDCTDPDDLSTQGHRTTKLGPFKIDARAR